MADFLQHAGLILFYIFLFLINLLIFAGLPGSWIALGGIAVFDAFTGFAEVGWVTILVMTALAVLGEVAESTLGLVVVARKGATKWGVLGAFLGGLIGAVAGTAAIPFVGSVIFALVGAFAGAVICEYIYYRSVDRALQTGFFAFLGKLAAYMVKFAIGLAILGIFIYRSW